MLLECDVPHDVNRWIRAAVERKPTWEEMPTNPGHSHVITLWGKKSSTLMTTTEFIILNQVFNQQLSSSQTSFTHPAQPDQLSC